MEPKKNHICCDDKGMLESYDDTANSKFIVGSYRVEVQSHYHPDGGAYSAVGYLLSPKVSSKDLPFEKVALFFRNHEDYLPLGRTVLSNGILNIHYDMTVLETVVTMLDSGKDIQVATWGTDIRKPNSETVGILRYVKA